jgi:hypothetical protein
MANLTKDRATTKSAVTAYREQLVANAIGGRVYYIGTLQIIDANGRADNPGAATAALTGAKAGVVKDRYDNSLGANDAIKVELETGVFRFDKSGTSAPTAADVGKVCYGADNHTISMTAADGPPVGRIWQVNSNSVDVTVGPLAA